MAKKIEEMTQEQILRRLKNEAAKILKVFDAGVAKNDLYFAVCLAVIEEFPQIRANQHVVAFFERFQEFQQREEERHRGGWD